MPSPAAIRGEGEKMNNFFEELKKAYDENLSAEKLIEILPGEKALYTFDSVEDCSESLKEILPGFIGYETSEQDCFISAVENGMSSGVFIDMTFDDKRHSGYSVGGFTEFFVKAENRKDADAFDATEAMHLLSAYLTVTLENDFEDYHEDYIIVYASSYQTTYNYGAYGSGYIPAQPKFNIITMRL